MRKSKGKASSDLSTLPAVASERQEEVSVVPLIEEHVEVRKELRTTDIVRVHKVVHYEDADVSASLLSQTVSIERVPKNVLVDSLPTVRTEDGVTIIPVVEEVLVVTKQLRLIEEVRITRNSSAVERREKVPLRRDELIIERMSESNPEPINKARELSK